MNLMAQDIYTAKGMTEVLTHEDGRKFAQIPESHAEMFEQNGYRLVSWGGNAVRFEPPEVGLGVSICPSKDGYHIRLKQIVPNDGKLDDFYAGMKAQGGVAFSSSNGHDAYTAPMFIETAMTVFDHYIKDRLMKRTLPISFI